MKTENEAMEFFLSTRREMLLLKERYYDWLIEYTAAVVKNAQASAEIERFHPMRRNSDGKEKEET